MIDALGDRWAPVAGERRGATRSILELVHGASGAAGKGRGSGDGWFAGDDGRHYWGLYGAAGLLLRAPVGDGTFAVLLQHRAPWSHQGGTWALPGGARDFEESAEDAAKREAHEEANLSGELITIDQTIVTAEVEGTPLTGAHEKAVWTYTTVIADAATQLETVPNRESAELRWVPVGDVENLPLHPGFKASWFGTLLGLVVSARRTLQ